MEYKCNIKLKYIATTTLAQKSMSGKCIAVCEWHTSVVWETNRVISSHAKATKVSKQSLYLKSRLHQTKLSSSIHKVKIIAVSNIAHLSIDMEIDVQDSGM